MRQVIQGKIYDTETATLVHCWTNGRLPSDFRYREKSLYRTPKGAYFLLHVGGAMTDLGKPVGDHAMGGSSHIEPLRDMQAALAFLETHGGSEAILQWFPEAVEEA